VLATFPLSTAARVRQANTAWKTVTSANGEMAKEAKAMRTAARTAARMTAAKRSSCLKETDSTPEPVSSSSKLVMPVDRTMAYEPLPLHHTECKAAARALELAERGQSLQREDLRLKQQRRDIYA
jgi:hypothetical protein